MSSSSQVQNWVVSDDRDGQRIDNYLMSQLKGVPRGHVYKILRSGEVRVNRKRVKPHHKIRAGDRVRVPPVAIAEQNGPKPSADLLEVVTRRILYEDEQILVLNKPAGLAVHGGSGIAHHVMACLLTLYPEQTPQLAHRLDRDTSGCLVCGKNNTAMRLLHEAFKLGRVGKWYMALVEGRWQVCDSAVESRLEKRRIGGENRILDAEEGSGKSALSTFTTVETFDIASLMEVRLHTGRTHQIRVQAATEGHPIAGDTKYGDKTFNKHMQSLGLKRLYLHASRLELPKTVFGRRLRFEAPMPEELRQVLEALKA